MCEYCENGKPLIGDEQYGACIENGNILVSYGECTDFAKGRINFCPQCWCHITGNPGPLHDLYKTRECCSKWEFSKWIRDSYLKKHPEIGEKK